MKKVFWPDKAKQFTELLGIEHPIIQAPMAGGPSTPELVAAVSNAGALGSLGAGYLSPQQLESDIARVKELTKRPFSVNLFIPENNEPKEPSDKVLNKLEQFSRELGIDPGKIQEPPKHTFEDQLEVVLAHDVPVFSFTFGIPEPGFMQSVKDNNTRIIGTATCLEEAIMLKKSGCDAVVAQGSEAGGHRGSFVHTTLPVIGSMALIPQLVPNTQLPIVASGGIMDGRGIAASLTLGASGVQMGTAFLGCKEADLPKPWLDSLLSSKDTSTVLTKTFTGKYARGVNNRFIREMSPFENEVAPYPIQNYLTRSIRNASKEQGDSEYMSMWAGQGAALSRKSTAKELVDTLILECRDTLLSVCKRI